jgi:tetratricopeptide (TPR) repeat protein
MNTRNRLLVLVAGIVLLAGCQSLEIPIEEAQPDMQSEAAAERTIRVAMTLPRPRPPQAEPLVLGRQLPEPGVPALPERLWISEPEDPPRSAALPYVPESAREFRLSPPSRPVEVPVLVFAPSARALAGAEKPPLPPVAAPPVAAPPAAAAAKAAPPAGETGTQAARAPAVSAPITTAAASSARAQTTRTQELPVSASPARPAPKQTEVARGERQLVARRGDPIAVDLEGGGWIYTGLRTGGVPDTGEQQGIDFLSRRNYQNRTSFNFKAMDYGDYELTFQYQDHQQAVLRSQVVHLLVVPEQDFAAALERQQPALSNRPESTAAGFEPVPGPPIRSADTLFDLGEYGLALIEYQRNMRSGDPYLNDRLAECYARTGEHLAAVKYYRENLGLEGEYGERAVVGLVRSSIATKDSRLLLEVLPSLFSLESVQIGGELLEVARFQTEDRRFSVAIQALEQYVGRYPDGRNLDEVYYRLARIYEVDSPYRDLESARHYYSLLYELFPESRYSDPAAERLNYLNRHFFLVQ